MNLKKSIQRIQLVVVNIIKQVMGQVFNLILSLLILRMYSKELWGGFSSYFLFIAIATVAISWGNKEFLLREFSKTPNKIEENFYSIFSTRMLLLLPLVIVTLLIFPLNVSGFFVLWIISAYISQSLEVFWIYRRDYSKSILIEIGSFLFLIGLLRYNALTSNRLIEFYAYYQCVRSLLYALIYFDILKKFQFRLNPGYFYASFSFFALGIVGFLQSRIDFVMVVFFENDKNTAIYQVISTYFILIHALGTFLIFPFMKNIYRLGEHSVASFQKFISLISPFVVAFCLLMFFVIARYIYHFELDFHYYVLGFLITFPPYLYTITILMLYKENKQHVVLRVGLMAIVLNSLVSFALLYFGLGLKGALIGSAVGQLFTVSYYLIYFLKENSIDYHHIRNQNITFYDAIADQYDTLLDSHSRNDFIRKKIADQFNDVLKKEIVLDFGGGTGEDLAWLSRADCKIIFCEPSPAMRSIAIGKHKKQFSGTDIVFLEDAETDFTTWHKELPFQEKADVVLANFAVINCIRNLDLLFKNLDLVTVPKATVFLLILDYSFWQKFQMNPIQALKSIVTQQSMNLTVPFENNNQLVYLHSVSAVKNASAENFEIGHSEQLKTHGFSLIQLIKK